LLQLLLLMLLMVVVAVLVLWSIFQDGSLKCHLKLLSSLLLLLLFLLSL
jgi:hypothetical protein